MSEEVYPDVLDPSVEQQDRYFRVACPTCGNLAGRSCVDATGYATLMIHGARVRAFERFNNRRTDDQRGTSINHPAHYNAHPSGVECIDVVEHMTFNVGNAVKYLWRAGLKGGAPLIDDLKKARWYIDREIQRLEKER